MNPLRMAVIGVGALGRHHARILSQMEGVELVALAEADEARGREAAEQHGSHWFPDYRQLAAHVELDAVSIVVPSVAHCEVATYFLGKNIPTLVEKPLAATVEEAELLARLARNRETLLQVGHIERFNPAFQTVREHCGTPKYIRAGRISPYTYRSTDIGVVHDLMIHDIDLVSTLVAGTVTSVEAFGVGIMGGHEDVAEARLRFDNGCIADLSASRVNPTASRDMQVWSFEGCLRADLNARTVTRLGRRESLVFGPPPSARAQRPGADRLELQKQVYETLLCQEELPVRDGVDALTEELASFVDSVRHGRPAVVDGDHGLTAMQIADEVLRQIAGHQWNGTAAGPIGAYPDLATLRRMAG